MLRFDCRVILDLCRKPHLATVSRASQANQVGLRNQRPGFFNGQSLFQSWCFLGGHFEVSKDSMDSLLWIESSYQIQALSWQDVNFVPEVEDGARPAYPAAERCWV